MFVFIRLTDKVQMMRHLSGKQYFFAMLFNVSLTIDARLRHKINWLLAIKKVQVIR